TYTSGTGISITGTVISTSAMTGDVTGSITANTLSKIQGKPISAPSPTLGQVLKYDGTQWTPGTDIAASGGPTYSAGTGITINGSNVISVSNLAGDVTGTSTSNSISNLQGKPVVANSPSSGEVLKYNGTQWVPSIDNVGSGTTYTAGTGITINGSNAISVNALSGDVTGNPNATVVGKIQSVTVTNTIPTTGQVLKYNGTSWAPGTDNGGSGGSYTAGTGIDITGTVVSTQPMGGDVTGSLIANTVSKIQNYSVSNTAPTNGYVLKWNGTSWAPAPDQTTGSSTNLWIQSGSNIYNFNGGNVGIGTVTPTSLFDVESSTATNVIAQFQNSNATNTSNTVNILNNGNGYNLYIDKTGQGEAAYISKNNLGSGTTALVVTNNGIGNTIDGFATGTGYAGNFNGGTNSAGGLIAVTTGINSAGTFDGGAVGNAIKATVTGSGFAGYFGGKTKIDYNSNTSSNPHLAIYEQTIGDWARINYYSGGSSFWSTAGLVNSTAAASKFSLSFSSTSDVMTATGDGNVGIGTNAPTYRLHLYGDATYAGSMMKMENNNSTNSNTMLSIWTLSSSELINATKSGLGYGANIQKTGTLSQTAAIYGGNAGANGEGVRGSAFGNGGYGIYGNAAGSGANSYYGVYGYGSGSAGADYGIYGVQGAGANDWAGYFSGNVGYTGMLLSTSDIKLKQNVQNFSGALQQVMQLQPKTYEYKHDGDYAHMNLPQGEQVGLIAQDLEKIIPSLVQPATFSYVVKDDSKDGEPGAVTTSQIDYKGVNYIGLIPVLIGAIQDQQKEIDELKLQLQKVKN
ncbi:MAG: tail fiber domain-containing protein, partial [Bacteroidota bacterium]